MGSKVNHFVNNVGVFPQIVAVCFCRHVNIGLLDRELQINQ